MAEKQMGTYVIKYEMYAPGAMEKVHIIITFQIKNI